MKNVSSSANSPLDFAKNVTQRKNSTRWMGQKKDTFYYLVSATTKCYQEKKADYYLKVRKLQLAKKSAHLNRYKYYVWHIKTTIFLQT